MREYAHTDKPSIKRKCACTNQCLVALFSLIVLPGMLPQQQYPPGDPYTISICVEIVALNATVRDRKGVIVSRLAKEDLQVYEDGIRQRIERFSHEDIPVTAGLVIDNSGTMGPKRSEVIASALAFARSSKRHAVRKAKRYILAEINHEHLIIGPCPPKDLHGRALRQILVAEFLYNVQYNVQF